MRRLILPIALAFALALAGSLTGATWSAFFSRAQNASNSFATAATFSAPCPSTTPTTVFMAGFEAGKAGTAGSAMFNGGVNGSSGTDGVDAAVKRNGGYSMKLSATGAQAFRSRGGALFTQAPSLVQRFAIRLASLPSADVKELMKSTALNSTALRLGYKTSTQRFTLAFGDSTTVDAATLVESNVTVAAGTWYVIDLRHEATNNPNAAHWRINGSPQSSTSKAVASANISSVFYGSNWPGTPADTFSANYDDITYSQTSADYPLGDGRIVALKPNASGTHVNPSNVIQDQANAAVGPTSWSVLDDVPLDGLTDYVKQTAINGSAWGEFGFEDTTETCFRAVRGYMTYDTQAQSQTNHGKTSVFDGATERVVYSGTMTNSTAGGRTEAAMVPPASAPWTQSAVNGLVARIGYSSDITPVPPRWTALMLEVDIPQ